MTSDAPQLPELTKRQETILSFIVRAYTEMPEPVSSKHLVEAYDPGVSSATIRNEMAVLEDLGYINAPHTSSGRVPTEQGYRYFVSRLLDDTTLSAAEQQLISNKFHSLPTVTDQWMRLVARILSRTAQTASLVTAPIADTTRFKHIELIAIQGRLVLMVLVLQGGIVQQRMLSLAEPVPQETLTEIAGYINKLCDGLYANQIKLKSVSLPLLEREIAELVIDVMERADSNRIRTIYREGLSDIISTFPDGEGAQQAVRIFEERAYLDMIISDLLEHLLDDVRVIVAGDGRWGRTQSTEHGLEPLRCAGSVQWRCGCGWPHQHQLWTSHQFCALCF